MIAAGAVFAIALLATYLATPWVIDRLTAAHLVSADMNKPDRPLVPSVGGFAVVLGLVLGILAGTVMARTGLAADMSPGRLLAPLACILMVALVGALDDVVALAPPPKLILPLAAAIPLAVAEGSSSTMMIPLVGNVDSGIAYPLILVPLGVAGAANVTNMLAGFNGAEAGMGSVACLALGSIALAAGRPEAAVLAFALLGALLAFLVFNRFPARVFIGDTGTLVIGTVLASTVIVGHFEAAGVVVILPYAADFVIKAANRFPSKNWWGTPVGGVLTHAGRPMGLAQALMLVSGGLTETALVLVLVGMEAAAAVLAIVLFLAR